MNTGAETRERRPFPWAVTGIIAALAATQILVGLWIAHAPPEGAVPTGMTIPDSSQFILAMDMFPGDFASPYATCQSPYGDHYLGYYPFTLLWPYGVVGFFAHGLGLDFYLSYLVANALSAAFYLAAVFWMLRTLFPKHAQRAFLLFVLSGGLGGLLYILSGLFGLHDAPRFDALFLRYAMYELMEGPHLLPVTLLPRLYYTFALGCAWSAFTLAVGVLDGGRRWRIPVAAGLVLLGSLPNLRCGAFVWGVLVIYLWCRGDRPVRCRLGLALSWLPSLAAAGMVTRLLLATSPLAKENLFAGANMAMWFSPFLSAALIHLAVAPRECVRRLLRLPPVVRALCAGAVGYLALFTALFLAYQTYYGNLAACRDAAVADRVSDPALLGAAAGLLWGWRQRRRTVSAGVYDWVTPWFLAYLAIAISAFGQGWFLRFGPHRLQVVLWLPLCLLTSFGLARLEERRPRTAKALWSMLVTCGLLSNLVAVACFQAPWGRTNARGPYAAIHTEICSEADARTMAALGPGMVLATKPGADAIVFRQGNPVVYGIGSFDLAPFPDHELAAVVDRFFAPETPSSERQAIARAWCADYVYCADTWPVPAATVTALRACPWLQEAATEGRAVLFEVRDGDPAAGGVSE